VERQLSGWLERHGAVLGQADALARRIQAVVARWPEAKRRPRRAQIDLERFAGGSGGAGALQDPEAAFQVDTA
jgi:hypothetical protein